MKRRAFTACISSRRSKRSTPAIKKRMSSPTPRATPEFWNPSSAAIPISGSGFIEDGERDPKASLKFIYEPENFSDDFRVNLSCRNGRQDATRGGHDGGANQAALGRFSRRVSSSSRRLADRRSGRQRAGQLHQRRIPT